MKNREKKIFPKKSKIQKLFAIADGELASSSHRRYRYKLQYTDTIDIMQLIL